jgi:hypothetical protein
LTIIILAICSVSFAALVFLRTFSFISWLKERFLG